MTDSETLARRFEQDRAHLRGVAFRMLGSLSDADDAVQEAWLRLHRSDTQEVGNLTGWLTTVVARVCLDMLRSRTTRNVREADSDVAALLATARATPEQETALANAVGLALLVVLEQLDPAERLAFVLHDMFAVPFDEIAVIVNRTPAATRQLASRARRRVQGAPAADANALAEQRDTVAAFLTALRAGDFDGLIAVLDPDVVVHVGDKTLRGATTWAKGAVSFGGLAENVSTALVDGSVGLIYAPRGKLKRALRILVTDRRITSVEIITDATRLAALEVAVLA